MSTKVYKTMRAKYTTVSEVLASALEKFGPKGERWIKFHERRVDDDGAKYCMLGALKATTRGALLEPAIDMLTRACGKNGYYGIPAYNDSHAHGFPAIKKVMCEAINTAVQDEQKESESTS